MPQLVIKNQVEVTLWRRTVCSSAVGGGLVVDGDVSAPWRRRRPPALAAEQEFPALRDFDNDGDCTRRI